MSAEFPEPPKPNEDAARRMLQVLWQKNLPVVAERVEILRTAAAQAAENSLTPEARLDAIAVAHKLAGSLGMFGYPQGTQLARTFEQHLELNAAPDAALLQRLTQELTVLLPLDPSAAR